jgi:uncharacterized protein YkwD
MRRMLRSRRAKTVVAGLAVAIVATACGPRASSAPSCAAPSSPPAGAIAEVFRDVNADRAAAGLRALSWNPQLYCLANNWSAYMAGTGTLQHRDLNATIRSAAYSSYRTLGENILRGPSGMTGAAMEDAWMASPTHRANILSGSFTSIGISLARGSDGRVYATQNFGG